MFCGNGKTGLGECLVEDPADSGFVFDGGVQVGGSVCGEGYADDGDGVARDFYAVFFRDGFDAASLAHEPALEGDVLYACHVGNDKKKEPS